MEEQIPLLPVFGCKEASRTLLQPLYLATTSVCLWCKTAEAWGPEVKQEPVL